MPEPENLDVDPYADVDPDVDLRDGRQRHETLRREWDILLAIAVGGVLGAEGRYGLGELVPHATAAWPWSTLIINVVGSGALAVLMAVIGDLPRPPRLLRPFVGVGVCGGFTTFSTFTLDTFQLLRVGRIGLAIAYVVASVLACVAGVVLAGAATRVTMRRWRA